MKDSRKSMMHAVRHLVSARNLATRWQCHPATVSRILERAGVHAYYLGSGKNGMKRYRLDEVEVFMASHRAR